jgi:hypothetical protein
MQIRTPNFYTSTYQSFRGGPPFIVVYGSVNNNTLEIGQEDINPVDLEETWNVLVGTNPESPRAT